jgi:triple functional domain protein
MQKPKPRYIFLLDHSIVISKMEVNANRETRYVFKHKLNICDIRVTEHLQGDELQFAIWTGLPSKPANKFIIKASSIEEKHDWILSLREQMLKHHELPSFISSATAKRLLDDEEIVSFSKLNQR